GSDKKILIVEDEWVVAKDIRESIESLGYKVTSIENSGEQALLTVKHDQPDLVIMDIKIKGEMDGIETANRMKTQNNLPIVYITAYCNEEILQRAKISEPYGYIIKPFKLQELHAVLENTFYKIDQNNSIKKNAEEINIKSGLDNLDKIDRQIINLLNQNGRMKLVDVSSSISSQKDISFSNVGVKKRLNKLIENKVVKIQCNLNLQKLGYIFALILLETANFSTLEELTKIYADCPRILFSFRTSGEFSLIYGIIAENIDILDAFINCGSPKTRTGIIKSKLFISTEILHPTFYPAENLFHKKTDDAKIDLKCLDCTFYRKSKCMGCFHKSLEKHID
ncbi:MAG: response regulator, partial [Promethearchaeota archaeon]